MTAEEVAAVHVAEAAAAAASSSSKVEIAVVEKDIDEKKKEKGDLSNGGTVKVDATDADADVDGDGSYVFVNGNDAVNGDPTAPDLEKSGIGNGNGNGNGGEDQAVENSEVEKGEAKSESESIEDGSRIQIADHQDKESESVESCHVDEEKQRDLLVVESEQQSVSDANANASHTTVADSSAKQSDEEISSSLSDSNGVGAGGLTSDSVKDSVEVSEADCNGDGLANESAKDTVSEAVVDTSNEQNGVSELPVSDDGVHSVSVSESNGDGLVNDSAKDTVSEAVVVDASNEQNGASELPVSNDGVHSVSVSESNGDVLPNVSAKDTVLEAAAAAVVESGVEHDDGVPISVSDSNGDGLPAADSEEDSKPEQNDSSDGVEANGDRPEENGCSEVPEAVHPDVEPGNELVQGGENEVDKEGELESEHNSERGSSLEADTSFVKETVEGSITGECGDALQDDRAQDNISETVDIDGSVDSNKISQEGQFSEIADNESSPVTNEHENLTVERDISDTTPTELETDTGASADVVESSPSPASLENVTVEGEIPESVPSPVTNEHEILTVKKDVTDTTTDLNIGNGASADVAKTSPSPASVENVTVEGGINDTTSETLPSSTADDEKAEPEVGKSDEKGSTADDEKAELEVPKAEPEVGKSDEKGSTADDEKAELEVGKSDENSSTDEKAEPEVGKTDEKTLTADDEKTEFEVGKSDESSREGSNTHPVEDLESSCLDNSLKSETKIISDSIVSEEAGVSTELAECDSSEPVPVTIVYKDDKLSKADVLKDSSVATPLSNDDKALPAAGNFSDVNDKAIPGDNGCLHESEVSHNDTDSNEQKSAVISGGIQFGSIVDDDKTCKEPEAADEVEKKKPFYYLIRVPRYDDENLKEKIRLAQLNVDEKTQSRDAIRTEMQSQRATCKEYGESFDAALSKERAARDLLRSKRQEIESIQSVINIDDIDGRIRNMEHMIQHETLPLKEEKQYIREIKQLKQVREQLSSNRGKQGEVQQGLDQKDQTETRMKSLKKEADQLRDNLLKAEAATKAAKKKLHDENDKMEKLHEQFKAADSIRQEAYAQLQSLKKQSYEKNKSFWQYRDAAKTASELALKGDKQALENLCVNQVERLMDLWNNNDEFRKEYLRCNLRSTLRRLRTLDGRALGPNEEPPVIPQVVNERVAKDHSVSSSTMEERTLEKVVPAKAEKVNEKPVAKALEQKNVTSKLDKSVKSVPPASVLATASTREEIVEAIEEKPMRTKEEEEFARKEEELRKAEEAAKLREQRRLEEIAKAKEALERKRRIAEKAQARAAVRAQKEAEQKEKEKEKRQRKKERRKVAASGAGDATVTDEVEPAPSSEAPAETPKESETREIPATAAKRPQKPSQFTKQSKAKSIPPPLRNRGKRRMQPWMWVLLTTLIIFALFMVGNSNFFFNFGLQKFNF